MMTKHERANFFVKTMEPMPENAKFILIVTYSQAAPGGTPGEVCETFSNENDLNRRRATLANVDAVYKGMVDQHGPTILQPKGFKA